MIYDYLTPVTCIFANERQRRTGKKAVLQSPGIKAATGKLLAYRYLTSNNHKSLIINY